jgi:hypothetical protein
MKDPGIQELLIESNCCRRYNGASKSGKESFSWTFYCEVVSRDLSSVCDV